MEAPASLMELLEGIHDPRGTRGKRHPRPALLGLAVVAMLAGLTSYQAVADYGRKRGGEFLRRRAFTRRRGLCKATYSRVFCRIDAADFEARVGQWGRRRLAPGAAPHLCRDGKTARGSRDGDTPGVHLLSADAPHVKAVLTQRRVDAKTNKHKAALQRLGGLPLRGRIVTGDAMVTHRDVCAKVTEAGGDSIRPAKENQPTLARAIEAECAGGGPGLSPSRPPGARRRSSAPLRSTRGTAGSSGDRSRARRRGRST